jgi:GH15 family glucan-1,4-alpha-glucosidase
MMSGAADANDGGVTAMAAPAESNTPPQPPIGDYGLIGDCRSAALVSSDGSLDWLCWPRFDSPSIFAALLDPDTGGRFRVRPGGAYRVERRYLPDTNVLETVFHAERGSVALRDLMPVAFEEYKRSALMAEHEILREIECLSGSVEMEVFYDPRPAYGQERARLEQRGKIGLVCDYGDGTLLLRSEVPLTPDSDRHAARGVLHLDAGESQYLSLSFSRIAPAVVPPLGEYARERLEQTVSWWREWAGCSTYEGPYRETVVRSALALKLMVYAPSGAVIAAPTTSLPEKPGGERNWDYRYCWLRDASFTLRALLDLGYDEEATAYVGWLLHATRLTWPKLQVVYDVFGEANIPERELEYLRGYADSRPVRIGNDAHGQLQLDVYGEVVDAVARSARHDGAFDRDTVRYLNGLGRTVCDHWRDADEGIWEGRSGKSHHTHSKVLCWVALDRLIELQETEKLALDVERFRTERDAIREEIERRGYNERLGSYVQVFDGDDLDAALLTLPLYGYIDARHPRMVSTLARIHEELGRDGHIYRYGEGTGDGLPAGEGAFGVCGFWAVECMALRGDLKGATRAFEHLIAGANDVGLLAEEIDPETEEQLGNFPQAFTHVGVINAALTLAGQVSEDDTALQRTKEHVE